MDAMEDTITRTGTFWTAIFHAFTATLGVGILSLPWCMAQLGWIFGLIVMVLFAVITCYVSVLLSDCYRAPDPITGRRNRTYGDAVKALLGPRDVLLSSICQYLLLWGFMIGYTVTTAISTATVKKTFCGHGKQNSGNCGVNGNMYIIVFGAVQIVLSQLPNLEKVTFLAIISTLTSFAYAIIALYLCFAKFATQHYQRGSIAVAEIGDNIALSTKIWRVFQALGNIACAFTYVQLLLEIQDTLKSPPPENKVMKRVTKANMAGTAFFYITLSCVGYTAFGSDAPGNVLNGFRKPVWLVSFANISVIVHLITAYQVFAQPIFALNERWFEAKWPTSPLNTIHSMRSPFLNIEIEFTLSKLILRTTFVILTTILAMMFPFFNAVLSLLGAISFFPISVYLPLSMYTVQAKIRRGSPKWMTFQVVCIICLVVSLAAAIGSVADIVQRLRHARLFHNEL